MRRSATAQDTEEELAGCFPAFCWALRDFSLELKAAGATGSTLWDPATLPAMPSDRCLCAALDHADGSELTPQQYLEQSLQPERGLTDQIRTRNRTRTLLKTCFTDRDCACLPRPLDKEADLAALSAGLPSDPAVFRPAFRKAMAELRSKLTANPAPK